MARVVTPPLTTMQVDKVEMGRQAVQLLSHRAEFPEAACLTTLISPRLITRQSVAAPRTGLPKNQPPDLWAASHA